MPDEFAQQAAQAAPYAGGGAIGTVVAIVTGLKLFAKPQDVELAKAELRAEIAEKYVAKEMLESILEPFKEDLKYIRQRLDQLK